MARLTKEEKKVFDPTFLIRSQKREAKIIKDLMIGEKEPGKEEGGHSPYQPWKPAPGGPYVPAPGKGKEIAGWTLPGGTRNPLTEELYWDGLKTILETTEANSDEQNMRLNILWHQFHDQVKNPQDGMRIAQANKKDIKTPDNFSLEDMPKEFQERFREMQRQHEAEKLLNKEGLKIKK